VGTGIPSPLASIARLGQYYRSLIDIAGAAMHDAMISRLLVALDRYRDFDKVHLPSRMRSMAGFLFLYLANHGWQHRGHDGTLMFGKNLAYSHVLREVTILEHADHPEWLKAGQRLNEKFEVRRGFLRTHGGVSIAILVSFATFLYAASNDTKKLHLRALDIAAGVAGVGSSVATGLEIAVLRSVADDLSATSVLGKKLSDRALQLGALSAAFGLVASAVAGLEQYNRGNSYGAWTHWISAASSGLSIAGWLSTARFVMFSFYATGIGLALGIVVFAMVILEGEIRDGTEYLMETYWRNVDHPKSEARRFPAHLKAVDDAIAGAIKVGAFDEFHMRVGSPKKDLSTTAPPTFHAAHALGFEQEEIAALFNVRPAIVRVQAGIEAVDYKEALK